MMNQSLTTGITQENRKWLKSYQFIRNMNKVSWIITDRFPSCLRSLKYLRKLFVSKYMITSKWYSHPEYLKTYYNIKNETLPVFVTNMFSTFSRAHAHDTRLDMILDEQHPQTAGGELCIHHLLPKTINNFDSDLKGMVVSHSYQSFVSNVKKKMISHYFKPL